MRKEYDAYVMCSTLNQMVNYLPFKNISKNRKIEKIYNITLTNQNEKDFTHKRFDNEQWDENIDEVLKSEGIKKIKSIPLKRKQTLSIDTIVGTIERKLGSKDKIVWNITGGQRNILMGIYKFIESRKNEEGKSDTIIYLEGDSNRMIVLEGEDISTNDYSYEDLTIEKALNLAGFEIGDSEIGNLLKEENRYKYNKYERLYEEYIENEDLRKALIGLNKKKENNTKWKDVIESSDKLDETYIEKIQEDLDDDKQKNTQFGYILEKITVYRIIEAINNNEDLKDYFVDMRHSCKTYFSKSKKDNSTKMIFEFDIVLLSKTGQMVLFECKSGSMGGTIAKSRRYSAYAAAGVYGKPIIITPFLNKEVLISEDKSDSIYEEIRAAIRSAKRAEIETWGVDAIGNRLEKLFLSKN